jgi:hypothetical protein
MSERIQRVREFEAKSREAYNNINDFKDLKQREPFANNYREFLAYQEALIHSSLSSQELIELRRTTKTLRNLARVVSIEFMKGRHIVV